MTRSPTSRRDLARIAVLRANGLGDLVVALPALRALADTYPDAHLTLLGHHAHASLAGSIPGVRRLVVVPPYPGVTSSPDADDVDPARIHGFLADLRSREFDLALQAHGGGR
jgi:ADP-heptose:LPS heptosyltransferase